MLTRSWRRVTDVIMKLPAVKNRPAHKWQGSRQLCREQGPLQRFGRTLVRLPREATCPVRFAARHRFAACAHQSGAASSAPDRVHCTSKGAQRSEEKRLLRRKTHGLSHRREGPGW